MRLPDYISSNIELILADWETFARGLPAGSGKNKSGLRDHAALLLTAAVEDMNSKQTATQKGEKSQGEVDNNAEGEDTDASVLPGMERASAGFGVNELLAEYRALRTSVIQLWGLGKKSYDNLDVEDILRFNESIDQSLAVSAKTFTDRIERAQQTFLAILGHDLRNPVNAIKLGTVVLSEKQATRQNWDDVIKQMASSADTMEQLISDLIQFAGSVLGPQPPLVKTKTSLRYLCQDVIAGVKATNPTLTICFEPSGEFFGEWDEARLRQVVSNLLSNSVQCGALDTPIDIKLTEEDSQILLKVSSQGLQIPPMEIATIFDSLVQGRSEGSRTKRRGSMGLGLYIVKDVVSSHGGKVEVQSSPQGQTIFSVRLPKGLEESAKTSHREQ